MAEICFLGTGGAFPSPERDNTSFLIRLAKDSLLVDCPGSVAGKIKKMGFDPLRVKSILITHVHPDHVYGLPSFVHSLMLHDGLITVYGSEETVDFCRRLVDLFDLRAAKVRMRMEFAVLKPGDAFRPAASLEVTSFEVPHSSSSLGFLFRFEEEKKEVVYSGDSPPHIPLFELAAGKDYLVHDCSAPSRFFKEYPSLTQVHTHSLELGELSRRAGVKCLIPCHFFQEIDFAMSEIEAEIRTGFKGKLLIPRDLERIAL